MSRIKREAERAIIYCMVIGIVQRFDAAYRQYHGRSLFSGRSSLGSSLETYLIGAAVLIGEAEGQLFTAYKLASFLGLARGTVQRKLDHLERVKAVHKMTSLEVNGSAAVRSCSHVILTTSTVTCARGAGICTNINNALVRSSRAFTNTSIMGLRIEQF